MLVVGLFQLVLDDHMVSPVVAKHVEFEVPDPVFCRHAGQFAEIKLIGKSLQVLRLRQPRGELAGLVFPCLTQRNTGKGTEVLRDTHGEFI